MVFKQLHSTFFNIYTEWNKPLTIYLSVLNLKTQTNCTVKVGVIRRQ